MNIQQAVRLFDEIRKAAHKAIGNRGYLVIKTIDAMGVGVVFTYGSCPDCDEEYAFSWAELAECGLDLENIK